jgi:predicted cation transporter
MMMTVGLFAILVAVLSLPFLVRKVEERLEFFLFAMGLVAVSVTKQWSWSLVYEGFVEPFRISLAVLAAGLLFLFTHDSIRRAVKFLSSALGIRLFAFIVLVVLGLISSVITAIIAALVLVEIVSTLSLDRKTEIRLVVIACFAIGMGAVLTPLGEPLATIVIAKLRGEPYNASFWFLFAEFWRYVVPGVFGFGFLAAMVVKEGGADEGLREDHAEGIGDVLLRTAKTYFFVMALVFLGTGFKPIIDIYISKVPAVGLFWLNSVSAVLDNATLAAAEVGPTMSLSQLAYALLGLIIAGGILIPGNIPNIISAGKLRIKSREWMAVGLPIGAGAMAIYFAALLIFGA